MALTFTAHAYGPGGQQGHNGHPLHQLIGPVRSQLLPFLFLPPELGVSSHSDYGRERNCPGQASELTEETQPAIAVSSEGWAVLPAVTQDTSQRALSPAKANLKELVF